MGLTPFDIVLPAGNQAAKILIDGQDVANLVTRVTVDVDFRDRVPKVFLELPGEGVIQGEGIVTQVVKSDVDQRESVQSFLANIDPDALETAALEACGGGLGGGMSTGQAFLEVLKGYVRGDADGS